MTVHETALLAGLFLPPVAALLLGHRLARRSARQRAAFWGVLAGHGLAALAATVAALYLPERWQADDLVRGALGYWALALGGLVGGIVGWLLGGGEPAAERRAGGDRRG